MNNIFLPVKLTVNKIVNPDTICRLVYRAKRKPQWALPYDAVARCRCTQIELAHESCPQLKSGDDTTHHTPLSYRTCPTKFVDNNEKDSADYLYSDNPLPFMRAKHRGGKTLQEWFGCG